MMKFMVPVVAVLLISTSVSADAGAPNSVVVRVNGSSIVAGDVEAEVNRLIPQSVFHGGVSEEKRGELREKAIKSLIERELQYQDGVRKGLKPDRKRTKERMKQIRDRFRSKKEYRTALEQAGLTESELKKRVEREILVELAFEKAVSEPSRVGDGELLRYYEQHLEKFKQPESVKLRIISIKDEKKAKEVLVKVKQGEDFSSLAALFSEDMYRIKGGDIGYVHKGRIFPELEQAAFKMQNDQTSELIKAQGTWFLIRVDDRQPERQLTFEESKDRLKKDLEKKRADELMEKWMSGLRSGATIEVLEKEK